MNELMHALMFMVFLVLLPLEPYQIQQAQSKVAANLTRVTTVESKGSELEYSVEGVEAKPYSSHAHITLLAGLSTCFHYDSGSSFVLLRLRILAKSVHVGPSF